MSEPNGNHKRNRWLITLACIFLLAAVAWLLYWAFYSRFYVYTDDAYVHGNEVTLTPQVSGGVKAIYADDTDLVEAGQLLVELDRSDYLIAFEEQKKKLASTVREVNALFQQAGAKEAEVEVNLANLRQAELDLKHREPLVKTGAVSLEEFETFLTAVEVAKAQVTFSEKELEKVQALIEGTTVETHPMVQEAVWTLRESYLNLIRTSIWAPVTGYIAKRSVQVGDQVSKGETLLYIVPLDQIWVEANYKETHLKDVRIGQPVSYTADLYGGGVKFHGKVIGFQPGSGNAFALLPPENASGNWIKIIQRVPVRISIDPEEIKDHPLLLGLSIRSYINVHDEGGERVADKATEKPLYTTPIYTKQLEELIEIDPLIDLIIKQNIYAGN